jgi:hypothetical protein
MLHRVRGTALLVGGDVEAARAELVAGLSAARAEDNRYEEALVLLAGEGLAGEGLVGSAPGAEAASILAGLGVVGVPLPAGAGASYPRRT